MAQLSQKRSRHRCLSSFSQHLFKHTGWNKFVYLFISLARIQSATRSMLQKELIIQNTKLLLKMTISNLKKTWTNTALFQFGLAKSDIRQLPPPKVKFKDDFLTTILNCYDFDLLKPKSCLTKLEDSSSCNLIHRIIYHFSGFVKSS